MHQFSQSTTTAAIVCGRGCWECGIEIQFSGQDFFGLGFVEEELGEVGGEGEAG